MAPVVRGPNADIDVIRHLVEQMPDSRWPSSIVLQLLDELDSVKEELSELKNEETTGNHQGDTTTS